MRLWLVVGPLLCAVSAFGQQTEACPFPKPRLASGVAKEVAWAAALLTRDDCEQPAMANELVAALRSMSSGKTDEHRRAVLHVLHAAMRHGVAIPFAVLRFEPIAEARIPWLTLQVRAATKDGRELFELFHSLDETKDMGWEFVGDALAARGNATFAVELRSQMKPTLRVCAGHAASALGAPFIFTLMDTEEPVADGWPETPVYSWLRNSGRLCPHVKQPEEWSPEPMQPDDRSRDFARLRWLAELVGESRSWFERFAVYYPRADLKNFAAFAAQAEERMRAVLADVDAQLRVQFKMPVGLRLPGLEVVWVDNRPEELKQKQAMPERKEAR